MMIRRGRGFVKEERRSRQMSYANGVIGDAFVVTLRRS